MENENIFIDSIHLDKMYPLNIDTIELFFSSYHEDECCEEHYIDFESSKSAIITASEKIQTFNKIDISGVPNMGILIRFYNNNDSTAVFFAGYADYGTGYYSDNLTLIVDIPNLLKKEYEISKYQPEWVCED